MPAAGAGWGFCPLITGTPIMPRSLAPRSRRSYGRRGPRHSGLPASRRGAAGLSCDACAPNTILSDAGQWSGHVDLGTMGTADRWADLAVATWSTAGNTARAGRAIAGRVRVSDDPACTRYYRLLWDLGLSVV